MKKIALLGSTGSIGQQTTQVVDWFPGELAISALAAHSNLDILCHQVEKYQPEIVALYDESRYPELKRRLPNFAGEMVCGLEGLNQAAAWPAADLVVTAVSGVVGLIPTLKAIEAGKDIALANKETLVAGGHLVMAAARRQGVRILPVDSEHSAVFQCLAGEGRDLEAILLTASGGPFRDLTLEQLAGVTPDMALKHPTWQMGRKVTIDSATMMNKGLEVMEAHWLFGVPYDRIQVVVHPQSIIHSMVQYQDGSILGHLGKTDMRIPIQYALSYPRRWPNSLERIDFGRLGGITFADPDVVRFPCLALAYQAGRAGGTYPTALNAANEVLVEAFLAGRIPFTAIPDRVERVMAAHGSVSEPDLQEILAADGWARELAMKGV